MVLVLAYLAGLLTLINPCVLPILPIVLATALQVSPRGPAAVAAGMALSFVVLGMGVAVLGRSIGIDEQAVARLGALLMLGFGLVLVTPPLSRAFATATSGLAGRADRRIGSIGGNAGLAGQFWGGALLGAVWSPCIGPTLGGAIGLASQGQDLGRTFAIFVAFALGVATVILALGHGARGILQTRRADLVTLAQRARPVLGWAFVIVGLMILTGAHHVIEVWLLDHLPIWLMDLSVSI